MPAHHLRGGRHGYWLSATGGNFFKESMGKFSIARKVQAGRTEQHGTMPRRQHKAIRDPPTSDLAGNAFSTSRPHGALATSAIPIGMPGCPELACSTASIARARIALASREAGLLRTSGGVAVVRVNG
jgi:hypothetical protein